jgi:hypothetical protein
MTGSRNKYLFIIGMLCSIAVILGRIMARLDWLIRDNKRREIIDAPDTHYSMDTNGRVRAAPTGADSLQRPS